MAQPNDCGPGQQFDADRQECVGNGDFPTAGSWLGEATPGTGAGAGSGGCPAGSQFVYSGNGMEGSCQPSGPRGPETNQLGGGYGDFNMPEFNWSNFNFNPGDAPDFHAPRFNAPTAESVLSEPGYDFRLKQGTRALEQSAAGRGVLRTGGTLKGIEEYGQGFASNEYSNAFNRALQSYDRLYQGTKDEYAPKLITYQTRAQTGLANQAGSAQQRWQKYLADLDFNKYVLGLGQ